MIVRGGPQPASRVVNEWVAASGAHEIVVGSTWRDPSHTATQIASGVTFGPPDDRWMAQWRAASAAAATAVAGILDNPATTSEPFVARTLLRSMLVDSELVVASSMPVRDLEWYATPRSDVRVHANRGANGIDGTISTAIGVALASGHPTAVLLGDIAFLHDSTALVGIKQRGVDLTIVVIDNDGGGIFSFLPQATAIDDETFEQLFGTPHGVRPGGARGRPRHRVAHDRRPVGVPRPPSLDDDQRRRVARRRAHRPRREREGAPGAERRRRPRARARDERGLTASPGTWRGSRPAPSPDRSRPRCRCRRRAARPGRRAPRSAG